MTLLTAIHQRFENRQGSRWVTIGSAALIISTLTSCAGIQPSMAAADNNATLAPRCDTKGAGYARTELFFGKSIADGGTITDTAFTEFLDREVTPRFPAGFTVVPAMGHYREASGVIDHEASDMVILLYPQDSTDDASRKIDEIRAVYNKTFHQESVLREDEQPSCVSF